MQESLESKTSLATDTASGWGNVFWAANSSTSPTLKLCMLVDENIVRLLGNLAELGSFRSEVLDQNLLPLSHFTKFTVLTSKLTRVKGDLSKSVGYLLRQVCL